MIRIYYYYLGMLICNDNSVEKGIQRRNSEANAVRKHNYNCILDDGIY